MSTRARFFIADPCYPQNAEVVLEGEEFIHAKTVLRLAAGAEVVLLDGSGKEYSAIVRKVEKSRLSAYITGVIEGDKEPSESIYLLCGLLKNPEKNDIIVQKAVELGASKIAFFSSEYCMAYINDNKLARLNRISREAAKQCLRSRAPEVEFFGDFKSAASSAAEYKNKLFACEFLGSGRGDFPQISGSAALMVGSEGGFSEEEFAFAKDCGFTGVSLGKRILRAETAAIVMCALAAYKLGELR